MTGWQEAEPFEAAATAVGFYAVTRSRLSFIGGRLQCSARSWIANDKEPAIAILDRLHHAAGRQCRD
jgi:hypothetical protein